MRRPFNTGQVQVLYTPPNFAYRLGTNSTSVRATLPAPTNYPLTGKIQLRSIHFGWGFLNTTTGAIVPENWQLTIAFYLNGIVVKLGDSRNPGFANLNQGNPAMQFDNLVMDEFLFSTFTFGCDISVNGTTNVITLVNGQFTFNYKPIPYDIFSDSRA